MDKEFNDSEEDAYYYDEDENEDYPVLMVFFFFFFFWKYSFCSVIAKVFQVFSTEIFPGILWNMNSPLKKKTKNRNKKKNKPKNYLTRTFVLVFLGLKKSRPSHIRHADPSRRLLSTRIPLQKFCTVSLFLVQNFVGEVWLPCTFGCIGYFFHKLWCCF